MKAYKALTTAVMIIATGANAYLGQVISSFRSPWPCPTNLAISSDYLYLMSGYYGYPVYLMHPDSGSIYTSYPAPNNGYTRGFGYEYGGYLWVAWCEPPATAQVKKINHLTLSVYASFPVPEHSMYGGCDCESNPTQPGTIRAIISSTYSWSLATRHTTQGSLLNSFSIHGALVDPAWDYDNELIWFSCYNNGYVYAYTTAGSLTASFHAPTAEPNATCYRNGYMWIGDGSLYNSYVYKVHCPDIIGIQPGSLGRVKAIYR